MVETIRALKDSLDTDAMKRIDFPSLHVPQGAFIAFWKFLSCVQMWHVTVLCILLLIAFREFAEEKQGIICEPTARNKQ